MNFNKKKIKTTGILIFLLLLPIFINISMLSNFGGRNEKFNQTHDNIEDILKKDPPHLPTSSNSPPNADYFNFYKIITIDHNKVSGTGSHLNFPLLISIFDSDLQDDVQSNGDDIAFANDTAWLDHEIELFDQTYNPSYAKLVAWVRIPSLSTSMDTSIIMYYGNSTMSSRQNPAKVWDNSYKGVWHLSESNGGTDAIKDSTIYSNDGTDFNSTIFGNTGQISDAIEFTRTREQRIEVADNNSLDITNELTIEAWIKPDVVNKWMAIASKVDGEMNDHNYEYEDYYFGIDDKGKLSTVLANPSDSWEEWESSVSISIAIWQHVVFTYNSSTSFGTIYKNGASVDNNDFSGIGALGTNDKPFYIGFERGWTDEVFDGLIDEVRISNVSRSSDWIATQYENQYDPSSFYSVGPEQTGFANIQVNAIDLYGNPIPNVNVSIFNFTELKDSAITNNDGYALFTNISKSFIDGYNFTVNMTSNIEPFRTVTINRTSEAIIIDSPYHNVTLICNASRNIFSVEDVDGLPLDSGWIVVSKDSVNLQNCTIDATGHATFWWLNTTGYSYKVWYQDVVYDPDPVLLKSGSIPSPNFPIDLIVNLTTASFTFWDDNHLQVVSGVKLMFYNTSSGASVVNFTTDIDGKATFRWLTTNSNYNYSLNVTFYEDPKQLRIYDIGSFVDWLELNITTAKSYDIDIYLSLTELQDYETKIVLLMSDSIVKPWGTKITLRALFNVTKAADQIELLGPTYADSMTYQIYDGSTLILSGTIPEESDYFGRHQWSFETTGLEAKVLYSIILEASKAEYVAPYEESISIYILENEIKLNQSENDNSEQTVYWLDNLNMSVTPYGEMTEDFIIEQSIFQNDDHDFRFSIPEISSDWDLTEITFNIYNITTWNVAEADINITIIDPNNDFWMWHETNATILGSEYNYLQGWWKGITLDLDVSSPTGDNSFNFTIDGSFNGAVDIIADIYFSRDKVNVQYSQFNVTDTISLLSDGNGWAIKNVTFNFYNCRNTSDWSPIDPDDAIEKLMTNEGINYTFISHDSGTGKIIIDNITVYPLDDQFLFDIFNTSAIMFDVNITIEYIQGFYRNDNLETINSSETFYNFNKNSEIQISVVEYNWMDNGAILSINDIWNGIDYFLPSDVEMNITIDGITYTSISDVRGYNGEFSLNGFNKDQIYTAVIGTSLPVNFTLSFEIEYSRMAFYEIQGTIIYSILGTDISDQPVQYYEDVGCYIQLIDTSLIDANIYSPYTISFTCSKDNYESDTIDLDLRVLERLTLLGYAGTNKTGFNVISSSLYVEESVVYTFSYIDDEYGTDIQDLNSQSYDWNYYNTEGQLADSDSGDLIAEDNDYVLDFNTETRSVGRYEIWITLEKQNYESKQAIIILTVNDRDIDYDLGDMFEDKQASVVKGEKITLSIELTDPTKGDIPLKGAKVILEIGDDELEFEEVEDGVYELEFDTKDYEAFFTSNTITGTIKISKANYTSEDTDITIVIEMEEIEVIPGVLKIQIFYLLLLIAAIGAVVGSLGTYKYIQLMKIPEFVKKVRKIKKAIKARNEITDSLLATSRDESILKQFTSEWEEVGISLKEILRIKPKKDDIMSNVEGGVK